VSPDRHWEQGHKINLTEAQEKDIIEALKHLECSKKKLLGLLKKKGGKDEIVRSGKK